MWENKECVEQILPDEVLSAKIIREFIIANESKKQEIIRVLETTVKENLTIRMYLMYIIQYLF